MDWLREQIRQDHLAARARRVSGLLERPRRDTIEVLPGLEMPSRGRRSLDQLKEDYFGHFLGGSARRF